MIVRNDARRYAQLLRQVVELSGVSEREVERRLDLGGGTLSRIFSGRIELKLSHLLAVLAVIGIKPERFFQLAAVVLEGASEESLGRQVLAALDRLAPPGAAPPDSNARPAAEPGLLHPLLDEELDRRIDAALERLGIRQGAAGRRVPRREPRPPPPLRPTRQAPRTPRPRPLRDPSSLSPSRPRSSSPRPPRKLPRRPPSKPPPKPRGR
jgi:transcriptional regulator with XRE-family HTH domain